MLRKYRVWEFLCTLLILSLSLLPKAVSARPLPQETQKADISPPTAAEIIEAVNQLRIANGLLPLNTHPVLMRVAQWEVNAIAGGAPGHTRPYGLTLGQWLLSLGYPLSGDLSMDGYRSENWVTARTVQEALDFWLSDVPHMETMLSLFRSDIGAAVAVSDQVYLVLETALQASSGQMQYDAQPILTAIAQGGSIGADSSVPQYIIPVKRSTARPDGNVIHQVQYGQSLWSIAVTYNTTINQIRAWNNLGDTTEIYDGQVLLVQMHATQPPPPTNTPLATVTPYYPATPSGYINFPTATAQPTSTGAGGSANGAKRRSSPGLWVGGIVVFALVAGFLATWVSASRVPR